MINTFCISTLCQYEPSTDNSCRAKVEITLCLLSLVGSVVLGCVELRVVCGSNRSKIKHNAEESFGKKKTKHYANMLNYV